MELLRVKFPKAPAASDEPNGPPCEQSASCVAQSSYPAITGRGTLTKHLLIPGRQTIETSDQPNLVRKLPSYGRMPRASLHTHYHRLNHRGPSNRSWQVEPFDHNKNRGACAFACETPTPLHLTLGRFTIVAFFWHTV